MVGLPVDAIASSSSSCIPGRSRSSRSQFSPQVRPKAEYLCEFSPATTMQTSAAAALFRAAAIPFSLILEIMPPKHIVSIIAFGNSALMPSNTVTTRESGCGAAQSPRIVWLSALGPTTKIRLTTSGLASPDRSHPRLVRGRGPLAQ